MLDELAVGFAIRVATITDAVREVADWNISRLTFVLALDRCLDGSDRLQPSPCRGTLDRVLCVLASYIHNRYHEVHFEIENAASKHLLHVVIANRNFVLRDGRISS